MAAGAGGAKRSRTAAAATVVAAGAKLAVKYGPQAKIAWDNGGRKAASAAAKRARSLTAKRKALNHAETVVDGSVLKVAPEGHTTYVVFSGDQPIATYPPAEGTPFAVLLAHADLDQRERPRPRPLQGTPGDGRRRIPGLRRDGR